MEIIAVILVIIFFAATVRATFGFADALIAMPLLSLFISIKVATPLVAAMGLLVSIVIIIQDRQKVFIPGIFRLILFTVLGIPIGLLYLKNTSEDLVKIVLAIVLLSFSIYKLLKPNLLHLKNEKLAPFIGIFSGILGGAYNTNGPPIIIYGTLRNWPPENFRAILQGVFLPTNFFIVTGHILGGLWTSEVVNYSLYSLPVILTSIFLGSKLNKVIPTERFQKYIFILLILVSLLLLYKTLFSEYFV